MEKIQKIVAFLLLAGNVASYTWGYHRGVNIAEERQEQAEIALASEGWIKTIYQFEDHPFPPPCPGSDVERDEMAHTEWKVVGGFWWWRKLPGLVGV